MTIVKMKHKDAIKKISNILNIKVSNFEATREFNSYKTLDIYSLNSIDPSKPLKLHDHKMRHESDRYQLFNRNKKACVCCGTKASFWALQYTSRSSQGAHLNLYGLDPENKTVLFTKDHIRPKALGGSDDLDNYQIMCSKCNVSKGINADWNKLGVDVFDYLVKVKLSKQNNKGTTYKLIKVKADTRSNAETIARVNLPFRFKMQWSEVCGSAKLNMNTGEVL